MNKDFVSSSIYLIHAGLTGSDSTHPREKLPPAPALAHCLKVAHSCDSIVTNPGLSAARVL